jgi:NAD(P)H-dependent FMN reductase
MKEAKAKKHLRKMLRSFTAGTVLHLFSEVFRDLADEAQRDDDQQAHRQLKEIEAALFVVGLGIDSDLPARLTRVTP